MKFRHLSSLRQLRLFFVAFLLAAYASPSGFSAGVTIITHGHTGNVDGWVTGMADSLPYYPYFPGTNVIIYEISVTDNGSFVVTPTRVSGAPLASDPYAEIVVKLDWSAEAGLFSQYETEEIATAVVPRLLQTNFIAELGGHALAELPLHLIGHSRGGSLMCALSRQLGTNGVWVDHVTTLDPHPLNNDGNSDPLTPFLVDAPLRIYNSVLFADNYFQLFGGYPHGQFMDSSHNRQILSLPGGYSAAHSDTHLWYHSTIDLYEPAWDYEAYLYAADRSTWFNAYELSGARAGYYYSRVSGGDRLSPDRPAGGTSDAIRDGFNQYWDLGAGMSVNRTPLPANHGLWPNLIKLTRTGTNQIAYGQTGAVNLTFQWARPATSNATVSLYLDDDFNPFNGNDRLVRQVTTPGTTSNSVSSGAIPFTVTGANSTPGVHAVYAKVIGGGRTRYLYASEPLTVVSSFQPPQLGIVRVNSNQVRVDVTGLAGQRVALQSSTNLLNWQSLTTNWLTSSVWSYLDNTPGTPRKFYRAVLP